MTHSVTKLVPIVSSSLEISVDLEYGIKLKVILFFIASILVGFTFNHNS